MTEKQTFEGLGIKPEILKVLEKLRFIAPTPIQNQAIPVAIKDNDVIGIAQTGTGKTLAFGIPTIQKLAASDGLALIILPTRELALQVDESLSRIARNFNLKSAVLIGGQNMNKQLRDLKANPRIIISTPGRLIDHLERKTINLNKVRILVLDEADRMLDMGFEPQIKRILQEVPDRRQTMLFSATMPAEIVSIANRYMKTPLRVEVAPAGSATENVTHEIFFVKDGSKISLLETILKGRNGSTLVFSRTKHGAKRIAFALRKMGFTSTEIHSNRTLSQRMNALEGFKKGKYRIMVATDIAARGIDVKGIELVINYDLPDSPEDYVHRIGRTGRAKNLGHAISFATPRQAHDIRIIEKLIKKTLPVSPLPMLEKRDSSVQEDAREKDLDRDDRSNRQGFAEESTGQTARIRQNERNWRSSRLYKGKGRESDNPRRGFLPKKPKQRIYGKEYASPVQKGKEFYKEFGGGNFLETSSHNRPDRTDDSSRTRSDSKSSGDFGRKAYGRNRQSGKFSRKTNFEKVPYHGKRKDSEESFSIEPFMNNEKNPDYRKPFGSYKSAASKKGRHRTPFNKGFKRTSARAGR